MPHAAAEGDTGAAWVSYLDFEYVKSLTSGMVFTSLEYNITLDAPAAEDNVSTPAVQCFPTKR
jgi:hypothetical protein